MSRSTWEPACPIEHRGDQRILLAHGEGGRLTRRLIEQRVLPAVGNEEAATCPDAAILQNSAATLAFTTDSYVVSPLFFPGGDIGRLAVFGTTNDLVVAGAKPLWLSLSVVLEEGFPLATLDRVLQSIGRAAREVGVRVVTGDTKVVPRGTADGLFINTSGIGEAVPPVPAGPASLRVGDEIVVSGNIGRHGIAVLNVREKLGLEPPPRSDCGSLLPAVNAIRAAGIPIRAMRDATRGGIAAVLHEWSRCCNLSMAIDESSAPVTGAVRGACEILGLDPLFVANEGTMLVAVPPGAGELAAAAMRALPEHGDASRIGAVENLKIAPVVVRRGLGREQPLDEPLGALLPRIC